MLSPFNTPIVFVITMAGKSSRMGVDKFLLKKNNQYWLEILLHEIRNTAISLRSKMSQGVVSDGLIDSAISDLQIHVVLVIAEKKEEVISKILNESKIKFHSQNTMKSRDERRQLSHCWKGLYQEDISRDALSVDLVMNQEPNSELWQSIKLGLEKAQSFSAELVFISPVDCPLNSDVLTDMVMAYNEQPLIPCHNGKRGHPVLIGKNTIQRFLQKPGRFDTFLAQQKVKLLDVEQSVVAMNFNTPSDWEKYLQCSK